MTNEKELEKKYRELDNIKWEYDDNGNK